MKRKALLIFLAGAALGAGGAYLWLSYCRGTGPFEANLLRWRYAPAEGDRKWAEPLEATGLPNLHRISPQLYRGAQPTAEGVRQLKSLGIRTVLNLRSSDTDRDLIGQTGPDYERIPMTARYPKDEQVVCFLQIVTDDTRAPVFMHCQHGADRTGLMCAVYRIVVCGWSKAEAIAEMTEGGFGFHYAYDNLVEFLEELDVDDIRERAGLAAEIARQPGETQPAFSPGPM